MRYRGSEGARAEGQSLGHVAAFLLYQKERAPGSCLTPGGWWRLPFPVAAKRPAFASPPSLLDLSLWCSKSTNDYMPLTLGYSDLKAQFLKIQVKLIKHKVNPLTCTIQGHFVFSRFATKGFLSPQKETPYPLISHFPVPSPPASAFCLYGLT